MDPWTLLLDGWVLIRGWSWNAELVTGVTGSVSALATAGGAHWWQKREARVLPTLPSHVEALQREADESMRFFAAVHELTMSVTEAWNTVRSRQSGGTVEQVIRRDELRRCRDEIVACETVVRGRLRDYSEAAETLQDLLLEFSKVWSYSSRDNYRTETYTTTTTDSEGKTRTETRTRQVYVDTDHWFSFDRDTAKRSKSTIRRWLNRFADVRFPLLNVHSNQVDVAKLSAADRSFLERLVKNTVLEDAEAEVSPEELQSWANQWVLGTRIDAQLSAFTENRRSLDWSFDGVFQKIMASDASYHFKTRSRSHSGPPGYVEHGRATSWMRASADAWAEVSRMLRTAVSSANQLVAWADDPSVIETDRQYAEVAIAAYESAFPSSKIEVDQLGSWGWTLGLGAGAGLGAAALAWVAHPLGLAQWL